MAEKTDIQWCNSVFNPWSGCSKVSDGCKFCYAEVNYSVKMRGVKWGPNGNRIVASESMWNQPVKWNKAAAIAAELWAGESGGNRTWNRPRVFCASLADVFEDWQGPMLDSKQQALYFPHDSWNEKRQWVSEPDCGGEERPVTMGDVRTRLFRLIDDTPNLDWLVLTKRPENAAEFIRNATDHIGGVCAGGHFPTDFPNVWLGTSVEDRKATSRIDVLRKIPAAIRFLSIEPLIEDLGPIDLTGIHWVIIGGESGPGSRPCSVMWFRSIVDQCKAAGVAVFVKQLGASPLLGTAAAALGVIGLRDKKGGDMAEWPEDLRIREFPRITSLGRAGTSPAPSPPRNSS